MVEKLCDILAANKSIDRDQKENLKKAFEESSKEKFTEFLLEGGFVQENDLLIALGQYYQVPATDVVGLFFDTFLLQKFPKSVLLRDAFIPREVDQNMLIVIASEPDNPELLALIGEHVSYDIQFQVGLKRDICNMVKEFYDDSLTELDQDEESE